MFQKNPNQLFSTFHERSTRELTQEYLRKTEFSVDFLTDYIKHLLRRTPKPLILNDCHKKLYKIAVKPDGSNERGKRVAVDGFKKADYYAD